MASQMGREHERSICGVEMRQIIRRLRKQYFKRSGVLKRAICHFQTPPYLSSNGISGDAALGSESLN